MIILKEKPFFIFSLLITLGFIACGQKYTPREYKFEVKIDRKQYTADSIYLQFSSEEMLRRNLNPFSPSSYFTKSSTITVDSVLYGTDNLKIIALVISNVYNPSKQSTGQNKREFIDYNATFLFCIRENLDSPIKIYECKSITFGNHDTYEDAKEALLRYCFGRKATDHPINENEDSYNMDDTRFWKSSEFSTVSSNYPFFEMR
jgi:hypothetical protein